MRHGDDRVLTSASHGEHPQEEFGPDPGGGKQGIGDRDLHGVLYLRVDFSGLSGGGVPDEGPHTGKATGAFYLQALEVPSIYPAEEAAPLITVPKMWHTHARGENVPELTDRKLQPDNVYTNAAARHGASSEGGRYEF